MYQKISHTNPCAYTDVAKKFVSLNKNQTNVTAVAEQHDTSPTCK